MTGFKTLASDMTEARAASLTRPRLEPNRQLRKNDYLSFHTQAIVQSADVRKYSGLC